jgi:hypothetical protein
MTPKPRQFFEALKNTSDHRDFTWARKPGTAAPGAPKAPEFQNESMN